MKNTLRILLILVLISTSFDSLGQTKETSEKDNLIVFGDHFVFSVKEPSGWIGDFELAKEYSANIVIYKNKSDLKNGDPLIQVNRFVKQDEETEKDLESGLKKYKDQFENLKEQDLVVYHSVYKCLSKLVSVDGNFYQYIVSVNPGSSYKFGVSIAMKISKRQATEEELNAFKEIVASLIIANG